VHVAEKSSALQDGTNVTPCEPAHGPASLKLQTVLDTSTPVLVFVSTSEAVPLDPTLTGDGKTGETLRPDVAFATAGASASSAQHSMAIAAASAVRVTGG
jgi:hypothetical protein